MNGISVNAPPPQTVLHNIRVATIDEIIEMKTICDQWIQRYYPNEGSCNVVITGGVESGHRSGLCSHGNVYKLDFGLSPRLDEFIQKNYCCNNSGNNQCNFCYIRTDGALVYQSPSGGVYAKEGNHWDMVLPFPSCT
jgi:hypothetical protein